MRTMVPSIILTLLMGVWGCFAVDLPASPCPTVFHYDQLDGKGIIGKISLPYDGSTSLSLGVNASMKGYYTDNSRVKLVIKMNTLGKDIISGKTDDLSYDLYFPFQKYIPKITKIVYNRRVYCQGPPENLIAGDSGITNLWSGHNYFFKSPPQSYLPPQVKRPNNIDQPQRANVASETLECGHPKTRLVSLIFSGIDVQEGAYPWLAAMFTATGNGYNYKCTVNLISSRHVVTAGRCVSFYKLQIVPTNDILIVLGKSNLKNWATNGALTRSALKVQTHPDFDPNSGHCDISVITLDQPVDLVPICLPFASIPSTTSGRVAGWGADEVTQNSVAIAQAIDLRIVKAETCLYSNLTYYQLTSEMTFCASSRDRAGGGTCVGDSGAGFMIEKNGKYYLKGLASLQGKCPHHNYMVFCDVTKLAKWVKNCIDS